MNSQVQHHRDGLRVQGEDQQAAPGAGQGQGADHARCLDALCQEVSVTVLPPEAGLFFSFYPSEVRPYQVPSKRVQHY